jgi:hypothetical protein
VGVLRIAAYDTSAPESRQRLRRNDKIRHEFGVWRSLVAHLLWEQGAGGSNPLTPTTFTPAHEPLLCGFCAGTVSATGRLDRRVDSLIS